MRHRDSRTEFRRSKVCSPARAWRYRRPQQASPRREHQLSRRPKGRPRVPQIHVRSFRRVRRDRLSLALHVDEPTRFGIGATLRGGAEVDEHRVARLGVGGKRRHANHTSSQVRRGFRGVLHRRIGRRRSNRLLRTRHQPRRESGDPTGDLRRPRRECASATAGDNPDPRLLDHAPTAPVQEVRSGRPERSDESRICRRAARLLRRLDLRLEGARSRLE